MTAQRASITLVVVVFVALSLFRTPAGATDIPGVQPYAYDQPQVNFALVSSGDTPLTDGVWGDFNVKGLLDTGASGIVIDPYYTDSFLGLGLSIYEWGGGPVVFSDVAVGGSVEYNLSDSLELRMAPFGPLVDINDPDEFTTVYDQSAGPGRLQIGPVGTANLFPIVVVGMPAMVGKVVVVDPKPMDAMLLGTGPANQLHTHLYAPGTPFNSSPYPAGPGIPVTDRHVQTTLVDVSRFTQTAPPPGNNPPVTGPESAMLADNPFIGPNPLAAPFDADVPAGTTPGVTVSLGALSATGSFLFDTGAAVSFISQGLAGNLNVRYRSGTYPSSSPVLELFDPAQPEVQGTALADQFTQDITGIGGAVTIAGFWLDSLLLRTIEGDPSNPADPNHLRYLDVPVFVHDISVVDPDPDPGDGSTLTLDGIIGMNLFVVSVDVELSIPLAIDITDARLSPYEWVVFDQPNARIGLKIGPSIDDDYDGDGVRDAVDICPAHADSSQGDLDGDGSGDACDPDIDGDGQDNGVDEDDDNDRLSDEAELAGTTNPKDPDSDGDGIMDGMDRIPDVGSNAADCAGMGEEAFDDTPVTGQVTCAAAISIQVGPGVVVEASGDLELIAPKVRVESSVGVKGAGRITVISDNPTPVPASP